ncbi:amino acid permease [Lactobacillus johnsonii]|uniref:APC family permease n=1 Tax=Lactobacillus johnsonii TaxID=33959 RepID=UPI001C689BE3|nr:amino acid permease [Lactobacillus johnsonii]MBW8460355.1 amino acid permease [Lactobacillus johnsonii]
MKRQISFGQALATVVGTVIGGGVFFKIGSISYETGTPSLTLFVWILAGIVSIASGLTVSEIAAALPVTGGSIKYIEYTYGKVWGFLFGWAQMLVYFPANIAALSVIFGQQFVVLFNLPAKYATLIGLLLAIFLMGLNFISTKFSTRMQSVMTILKAIPIALIVLFGLFNSSKVDINLLPLSAGHNTSFWTGLSGGLLAALFAYDGWINVTNLAGEIEKPEKNLSRAIIIGLSAITLIYVLVNYAFLTTLPFKEIIGNQNTAYLASLKLFGSLGGKLVTIGILISVYGAINGFMLTGMRIPYTLAQNKMLPFSDKISRTNVNTGVPTLSALIILFVSLIMIILGTFDLLTNMLVFVMWTFTTLISIAVVILRYREPKLERPYVVPWYPIIPIISIGGGLFIVISTVINEFWLSITGIGLTLLGLPIYYYMKKQNNRQQ